MFSSKYLRIIYPILHYNFIEIVHTLLAMSCYSCCTMLMRNWRDVHVHMSMFHIKEGLRPCGLCCLRHSYDQELCT